MRVGIVDMSEEMDPTHLKNALRFLRHTPVVVPYTTPRQISQTIRASPITHWIFTGSTASVLDPRTTRRIPLDILRIPNKRFLLICYSMQSLVQQLGSTVRRRQERRTHMFRLRKPAGHPLFMGLPDPVLLFRDHQEYMPVAELQGVRLIADYRGEVMVAERGHVTMVQFHPERSSHGTWLLNTWVNMPA